MKPANEEQAHHHVQDLAGTVGHLIDGQIESGQTVSIIRAPWCRQLSVAYKQATGQQVRAAIRGARSAYLRSKAGQEIRRNAQQWLCAMADAVENAQNDLVTLISFESGKLIPSATAEVQATIASLRYWSTVSPTDQILENTEQLEVSLRRAPLGVVAAITPFNMPLLMMANKIGPALISGNTIICKPSPNTPITALFFAGLISELVPPGVVNIVAQDEAGPILSQSADVDMISFTGSIKVGKAIMASASATLKRVQLELGGNDPAIICSDADLATTIPKIFQSAFGSAGQACVAVKRVYAHEKVLPQVIEGLVELASQAVPGSPYDQASTMPAVTTQGQYDFMNELIADAESNGAVVHFKGAVDDSRGLFAQPTIISGLVDGDPLVEEEQFSPVLPIIPFTSLDRVIHSINQGRYGLGASVWSQDRENVNRVVTNLESGMVWVNGFAPPNPTVPFGGAKESGLGREGGPTALDAFTEMKTITAFKGTVNA